MSAQVIVDQWTRCLQETYLPELHGHQVKALASLSYGLAAARSCSSGQVCLQVPGCAKPASTRRRQERLLANPRLKSRAAMARLSAHLLAEWPYPQVLLILDETPKGEALRCMKLSLGFHRRVIPLLSLCYRPDHPPRPLPALVAGMLRQVRALMPPQVEVTLLADRGLCWPILVRRCRKFQWHWVLRVQSQTRFQETSGREQAIGTLVAYPGQQFYGAGRVFKKAGWEAAAVVACWPEKSREPWLLITDEKASFRHCRSYCKRTWCEETHRDEKSSGFQWQASKVNQPRHAQRLVLLLALAMLLAVALGAHVLRRGWRKALDPHRRRRLSYFQLGLRFLIWCIHHDQLPACPLATLPSP